MARKTESLIRLPQEVKERLAELAVSTGLSQSVIVEKLIMKANNEDFT